MSYFQTDNKTLKEYTDQDINQLYSQGFVFTRVEKGNLYQTKSLRIDLSKFELNSENRRILNKNNDLEIELKAFPLENYSWEIHALGKDFYTKRFGDGTMSASKIKEMFQDTNLSNMNSVLIYQYPNLPIEQFGDWKLEIDGMQNVVGFCPIYTNNDILHYAYPFYNLEIPKEKSLGLAMMTKAIIWAKEQNKKYVYLGSVTDSKAHYKLQFDGLEWWDNSTNSWNSDLGYLKMVTKD